MKKYLVAFLFIIGLSITASAQTPAKAQDWTKPDCDGNTVTLFEEINKGNCVIIEFVMMNCSPCVTAGKGLKTILADYQQSHPGKVKLYSMSFNNTTSCTALKKWKTDNGFTWPVFANGADEVEYYGGMGMPTIVVIGGNDKTVFYDKLGYSASDGTTIRAAIDDALATASVKSDDAIAALVTLYPNPASSMLKFILAGEQTASSLKVFSVSGAELLSAGHLTTNEIDISSLANGAYYISFTTNDGTVLTRKFTVQK